MNAVATKLSAKMRDEGNSLVRGRWPCSVGRLLCLQEAPSLPTCFNSVARCRQFLWVCCTEMGFASAHTRHIIRGHSDKSSWDFGTYDLLCLQAVSSIQHIVRVRSAGSSREFPDPNKMKIIKTNSVLIQLLTVWIYDQLAVQMCISDGGKTVWTSEKLVQMVEFEF